MREAGASAELRSCMSRVIHERLKVEYSAAPTGQVADHRKAVLKLFLGDELTAKEEKSAVKRARQRAILNFFCNGDWESDTIQFYSTTPIDRNNAVKLFEKYVLWAILPNAISMFPRHRWHGGEAAVDEAGLLFAVHNIGGAALSMFLGDRPLPAAVPAAAPSAGVDDDLEELTDVGQGLLDALATDMQETDPGELLAVDACVAETPAGPVGQDAVQQPPEPQPQGSAAAGGSSGDAVDWKAVKQSMKRMVTAWAESKPGPVLVIVRTAMRASVRLMRKFLYVASASWEKHQQLQAAQGHKRSYRVLEAWNGTDVSAAFSTLEQSFHDPIVALPLSARTNAFQVLAFRLIARMAGALHLLLSLPRSQFPYKLFSLLTSEDDTIQAQIAEELLASPPCLRDPASDAILTRFACPHKLTSAAAKATLQACALMSEVDVVSIETRHAAARRLLVSRQHTWSPAFADLAAEHLCRMARTDMQQALSGSAARKNRKAKGKRKARQPKRKRKRLSGNPKGRKREDHVERRGGGAQRAFFHERLSSATREQRKDRKDLFKRLNRDYKNLSQEEYQYYKDLGEMATVSARHGGAAFAPASTVSAGPVGLRDAHAPSLEIVPANPQEQLALSTIKAAERKARTLQRLAFSKEQAEAVELQEFQSKNAFESYQALDTFKSEAPHSNQAEAALEPGPLHVGRWCPDVVGMSKAGSFRLFKS